MIERAPAVFVVFAVPDTQTFVIAHGEPDVQAVESVLLRVTVAVVALPKVVMIAVLYVGLEPGS